MRRLSAVALGAVLCLAMASGAHASLGTTVGVPVFPGWTPNSTNQLNHDQLVPGREGQVAPWVEQTNVGPGSVELTFHGGFAGLAFFETRLDEIATGATAHPTVSGDTIHIGGTAVNANATVVKTFNATQYVDIRLALGGERDWDFNWTRFEVGPAVVPEPGTIAIWSGIAAMAGVVAVRRRRSA